MAQLTYGYETAKGLPGQKADLGWTEVYSRTNEEEDGKMKFGMAVMTGTTAGQTVKLPAAGAKKEQIEGVSLMSDHFEHDLNGKVIIGKGAVIGVAVTGRVWARLASGVTRTVSGAPAYVVVSGADAGCFTATSGESTVDIGATFGEDYDDGIAIVKL